MNAPHVLGLTPAPDPYAYDRSDLGNARRLVDTHGAELRYVAGLGWLVLGEAGRWSLDTTGEPTRRMAEVATTMLAEAGRLEAEDERKRAARHALASQNARRIAAALELAATDERAVVTADALDAHPHLLAVGNGTVDLRTGTLREPDPRDLLTMGSSVRFLEQPAPRWDRFLSEIFDGDPDLTAAVRRLVGYVLTGETREHVLPVLFGDGANGKSVFVGVLEHLLGELAMVASFDTFLEGHGGAVDYDLARLRGARFVVAQESARGRRLAESVVKQATGGDTITARHPYGRPFSYRPAFTAVLVTNHRPRADATDEAIWRRLRLIPFEVSFRGREDRGLAADLERELPGILAWAVRGAVEWYEHGLAWPAAVTDATAAYRSDEDPIAGFLEDECHLDPQARTPVADLRSRYEAWARGSGEQPLSAKALTQALRPHGIASTRTKAARLYTGLTLTGDRVTEGDGHTGNSPPARAREGVPENGVTACHPVTDTPVDPGVWGRKWIESAA